ncbi:MAG: hypothetical protein UD961_09545 [Bacteroidales bacterium]|nr:hypothetical protein [Bacteroidales bacterium]
MKKITYIIISSVLLLTSAISAFAEERFQDNWKEKIMSEKIAFLTMEMGITPEEAQVFWPVYNQVDKERDEAIRRVFRSYKDVEDAVAAGKGEKELNKLLDEYLAALKAQGEVEQKAYKDYAKVLPTEKLAKLYVAEEKFRRHHIRKLHGGGSDKAASKR